MIQLKRIVMPLLLLVLMFGLGSCRHKDLMAQYRQMTKIRLNFDWTDAPNANPEGMCVFFYPVDDKTLPMRRYDFVGREGGEIEIAVGKYRVICYNNDTEQIQFRGIQSFDTHEAYTLPSNLFAPVYGNATRETPRAPGAEGEMVVDTPDMMWGCSSVDMTVSTRGVVLHAPAASRTTANVSKFGNYRYPEYRNVQLTAPNELTLFPHEQICTYSYEILNVKNLNFVTQMSATLCGMSPHMGLAGEVRSSQPATIPVKAYKDGESTIIGEFYTFGDDYEIDDAHKLVLYVWFENGLKYYYTFNVESQIHNAPDRMHVHLRLMGLEFPTPVNDGGGFKPSVEGWDVVWQDVKM